MRDNKGKLQYDDIIELDYQPSPKRAHMSLHDRAAQFAPFAALTGHEEAIEETARLTCEQLILEESVLAQINETLYLIAQNISKKWTVAITYFQPDRKKMGGAYLTDIGAIKKIDEIEAQVIMESGIRIPMGHILSVEIAEKE